MKRKIIEPTVKVIKKVKSLITLGASDKSRQPATDEAPSVPSLAHEQTAVLNRPLNLVQTLHERSLLSTSAGHTPYPAVSFLEPSDPRRMLINLPSHSRPSPRRPLPLGHPQIRLRIRPSPVVPRPRTKGQCTRIFPLRHTPVRTLHLFTPIPQLTRTGRFLRWDAYEGQFGLQERKAQEI
jgi:hypothetical protein